MVCSSLRLVLLFSATLAIGVFPAFILADESGEVKNVELSGRIVDDQSVGVGGVQVRGITYGTTKETVTNADGDFQLIIPEPQVRGLSILADDEVSDRIGFWRADWSDLPTSETPIEVVLKKSRRLPVVVTDSEGRPAADVKVGAMISNSSLIGVPTDEKGEAVLRLPADRKLESIYATKEGVGFDFRIVSTLRDEAHRAEWINSPPIRFQLAEARTIELQLLDDDDRPVVDAQVDLWLLYKPDEPDSFNLSVMSPADREFSVSTDEEGVARFEGVPVWDVHPLTFWPRNNAYAQARIQFDPAEHPDDRKVVHLSRLVPISGRVVTPDGSPASGVSITVNGASYKMDSFRTAASTKEDGTFEVKVAPDELYVLTVVNDSWAAPVIDGLVVRKSKPISDLEFKLQAAKRIHGRVTIGPENKPVAEQRMSLSQRGRALQDLDGVELPNPENNNYWIQPSIFRSTYTDEKGNYEFFVGPGSFRLSGPTQVEPEQFEIGLDSEETSLEFNFASPRPEEGPFKITVVAGDPPRPVANAVVEGKYRAPIGRRDLRLRTSADGKASGIRQLHRTVLFAHSDDKQLAGIMEIDADQPSASIAIGPLTSARGVAIDEPTGDPLRNTKVNWGRRIHIGDDDAPWQTAWGGTVVTDANGGFELHGLVPGEVYHARVPRGDRTSTNLAEIKVTSAEPIELGELKVSPPYKPPTFEERIDKALASDSSPLARFEKAIEEAQRLRQHILVVFVDRESSLTRSWFKRRLEDRPIRNELANYQLLQIDVEDDIKELTDWLALTLEAESLPTWLFCDAAGDALMTARSVPRADMPNDDSDGDNASKDQVHVADQRIDRAAVMEMLARLAPAPLDARELLKDALAEAKRSDRRVIVQETATWCGPCHRLARFLEEHRDKWETDYIWIKIDQRWHGSNEVMDSIKEGYRGGIPWFAILAPDAQMLANSDGPDGNIGFPSEPEGIEHFMSMLQSTRQRMTDVDLAAIRHALNDQ